MKSLFAKRDVQFNYNKYYLLMQDRWARKMTNLTKGFSRGKLICLLVLFTVFCAGFLLYKVYTAFAKDNSSTAKNLPVISKIKIIN